MSNASRTDVVEGPSASEPPMTMPFAHNAQGSAAGTGEEARAPSQPVAAPDSAGSQSLEHAPSATSKSMPNHLGPRPSSVRELIKGLEGSRACQARSGASQLPAQPPELHTKPSSSHEDSKPDGNLQAGPVPDSSKHDANLPAPDDHPPDSCQVPAMASSARDAEVTGPAPPTTLPADTEPPSSQDADDSHGSITSKAHLPNTGMAEHGRAPDQNSDAELAKEDLQQDQHPATPPAEVKPPNSQDVGNSQRLHISDIQLPSTSDAEPGESSDKGPHNKAAKEKPHQDQHSATMPAEVELPASQDADNSQGSHTDEAQLPSTGAAEPGRSSDKSSHDKAAEEGSQQDQQSATPPAEVELPASQDADNSQGSHRNEAQLPSTGAAEPGRSSDISSHDKAAEEGSQQDQHSATPPAEVELPASQDADNSQGSHTNEAKLPSTGAAEPGRSSDKGSHDKAAEEGLQQDQQSATPPAEVEIPASQDADNSQGSHTNEAQLPSTGAAEPGRSSDKGSHDKAAKEEPHQDQHPATMSAKVEPSASQDDDLQGSHTNEAQLPSTGAAGRYSDKGSDDKAAEEGLQQDQQSATLPAEVEHPASQDADNSQVSRKAQLPGTGALDKGSDEPQQDQQTAKHNQDDMKGTENTAGRTKQSNGLPSKPHDAPSNLNKGEQA